MPKKRYNAEEIIHKLRGADDLLSQGENRQPSLQADRYQRQHSAVAHQEARDLATLSGASTCADRTRRRGTLRLLVLHLRRSCWPEKAERSSTSRRCAASSRSHVAASTDISAAATSSSERSWTTGTGSSRDRASSPRWTFLPYFSRVKPLWF